MRILIAILLFSNLISNLAFARVTTQKFIELMKLHRARVHFLGTQIFNSSYYQIDLPYSLVIEYLSLHDLPKILSLEELRKWDPEYTHSQSIATRLAPYFGEIPESLSSTDASKLDKAVKDLNDSEDRIKASFFLRHPELTFGRIQFLKHLERVSDVYDTYKYRRGELQLRYKSPIEYFLDNGEEEKIPLTYWVEAQNWPIDCASSLRPSY